MRKRNENDVPVTFAKGFFTVQELIAAMEHVHTIYARNYVYSGKKSLPCELRVNSKIKVWKRNPDRFRFSVKYGLYDVIEITSLAVFNRDFAIGYERI